VLVAVTVADVAGNEHKKEFEVHAVEPTADCSPAAQLMHSVPAGEYMPAGQDVHTEFASAVPAGQLLQELDDVDAAAVFCPLGQLVQDDEVVAETAVWYVPAGQDMQLVCPVALR